MHPVPVPSQPFTATPAKKLVSRSTAVRKAIHFVNLWTAGRSSGNLAMNSVPKPAPGSETSGREDFAVGDKDAVVIVDHGSRRQESNLMLNDFVEMFRAKTSYRIVEPAHMASREEGELQGSEKEESCGEGGELLTAEREIDICAGEELAEPTIKDAFGKCVQQGASRVIISPYFLSPGRHWKQDIPALAAVASKEHSNIPYIVTAPLGLHELMVETVI
ncbi:sirohydrochlorin ferrochelatase isoform X2 [Zea mays]|uniref:sirohydrochlorin ferrochelatase isoform X2 n=1 Tax=Zea mays TaxID=4577 RepID=UPI000C6C81E1|nr:sirohydrochlorin ferrochelatase isoform X2 [Zea mays]|eukprot:XP_023157217.1 sirohydrochlorin ferrochelatase isoform X2 [Zea mays]